MFQRILTITLLIPTTVVVLGQNREFGLSIYGGHSQLSNVENISFSPAFGISAFATLIENKVGARFELGYFSPGADYTIKGMSPIWQPTEIDINERFHYLRLPVSVVFRPVELFELRAGGWAAFTRYYKYNDVWLEAPSNVDFGLTFSAGFRINSLMIGAVYNHGLMGVVEESLSSREKWRVYMVEFSYSFISRTIKTE